DGRPPLLKCAVHAIERTDRVRGELMNRRVFREYDIRGNADADFPDDFVADLGRAAGAYFADRGARRITLGRDCRLSSPRIHAALKRELLASGLDIIDV